MPDVETDSSSPLALSDHTSPDTGTLFLAASSVMAGKPMDQTSTTLSVSSDEVAEEKEDDDDHGADKVVINMPPTTRFVFKDDCEPPSPIRRMTDKEAADYVVMLNTRHSLLAEETDTEGEEDDPDDEQAEDDYDVGLVNLSFRIEMEEHARDGEEVLAVPVLSDTTASKALSLQPHSSPQELALPETSLRARPSSTLHALTEELVDSLCFPSKQCGARATNLPASSNGTAIDEKAVEQDILQLLSCSIPPNEEEISHLWDMETALHLPCTTVSQSPARLPYSPPIPRTPTGPHRPGPRERVLRLRQWRRERSPQALIVPDRTYSVDIVERDGERRTRELDDNLMYDSDPEMSVSMRNKRATNKATGYSPSTPKQSGNTPRWTIRESMNQTWDLVWHTRKSSTAVRVWMERGTIVGDQMLEPALVWRHANKGQPVQLRFLNICRILPLSQEEQRGAGILARPSCTLRLLTSTGEEFFLEAPCTPERNKIVETWKLCVARFATLAVLEDLDNIQREFFHPISHAHVPDVEETMHELYLDERHES